MFPREPDDAAVMLAYVGAVTAVLFFLWGAVFVARLILA